MSNVYERAKCMTRFVGVAKAAKTLGVSRTDLQQLIRRGDLHTFEGKVDMEELRECYPGLALEQSAIMERTRIIKESAFGERLQRLLGPEQDLEMLKTQLRQLKVQLNVERTKARDYQSLIEQFLEHLAQVQQNDATHNELIRQLNLWLIQRFERSKGNGV